MKIIKRKGYCTCWECGRKNDEKNAIYEIDFGTYAIQTINLCCKCINRLWCNIDILIGDELMGEENGK